MLSRHSTIPDHIVRAPAETCPTETVAFSGSGTPGGRGLAMISGFWLVIADLLGARVAMCDDITAARGAGFVSTQVASLATALR